MDGQVPYLLSELSDVTSIISYPLQCTQRIKYTCFDVSKSLLVFGATSGGLYVFNRDPCSFVQLIPNKEGTVTQIKISPDEKSVAFATARGIVCVCDCGPAGSSYVKSPRLQTSKQHQGNEITSIAWSCVANQIYIGDDTGRISVLYLSNFIAKNVFQTTEFTLMSLDSRIVQLDIRETMLLVSTMTRCYICDTVKEQYRQIGQKLRDGEYGGCFFYSLNEEVSSLHPVLSSNGETNRDKVFNAIPDNEQTENYDKFNYIKIFSARPGSRLWEVKIDGTVLCTHQFKQLLAMPPAKVITLADFDSQNFEIDLIDDESFPPQSLNFSKVFMLANKFIFTFKKDGIYIFDPKKPAIVLWSNKYSNIVDCKIIEGYIYLWLGNGNIITLSFGTVEKFLLKCFVHQKYKLCAQVCALHVTSIVDSIPSLKKIHLISGLGEKLQECCEDELYEKISPVLDEICKIKRSNGQKLKSGIFVVDNSYYAKSASRDDDNDQYDDINMDSQSKTSSDESDSMLFQISPDAIQVIKGISNTVSEKLSSGTKSLKKTWDHFEDKMKNIGIENTNCDPLDVKTSSSDEPDITLDNSLNNGSKDSDDEIITNKYCGHIKRNTSTSPPKQSAPEANKTVKTIYHHIKLSDINKLDNSETIYSLISETSCDINDIYRLVNEIEQFMITAEDSVEYSKLQSGKTLLQYISKTPDISETVDRVIENDEICSYFLQAFVNINSNAEQILSCECGYPLPKSFSSQTPSFSDIIDVFIEKRWNSSQSEQCYDICKKVPFMWRKILFLRRNEDLLNLLFLILQMLDEDLLYSFLPQFTVVTWEKAIKLFGTLKNNECLNCGRKFECPDLSDSNMYNHMLSWDSIGALMIKSVGCQNTLQIMKTYSDRIPNGELTLKFYHTCLIVKMFEKYDGTVMTNLIDTIYEAYKFEDAVTELTKHLGACLHDDLPHTSLPLAVASKSSYWGLNIVMPAKLKSELSELDISTATQPDLLQNLIESDLSTNSLRKSTKYQIGMNIEETLNCLDEICPNKQCNHCCLPLDSRVLVADGGLWVFSCGHTYHGVCLTILKIKLCSLCFKAR